MRAIVKQAAGPGAALLDVPAPGAPGAGQVLVKPLAVSICGTDYHVYSWDAWSERRVKPPRIMGHEFAGEIIEIGRDVENLKVGDYVSGESHWVCDTCLQCRTGQKHLCAETRIFGVDADGCFADYALVPRASVWKNHRSVSPDVACIQDPLGNAIHATLAGEITGKSVAILGCGPIGLFAVAVARAAGATRVLAVDTGAYRLGLAQRLGADATCNARETDAEAFVAEATHGAGVDVVLEMSGAPVAIQQSMRIARRGGRVSLMGIPSRPVELDVAEDMVFKGLDIKCIVGRKLYETWDTMHALLDSGRLNVEAAITHRLPFEEFAAGMDLMRNGLCGKVVLIP